MALCDILDFVSALVEIQSSISEQNYQNQSSNYMVMGHIHLHTSPW